MSRRNHKIQTQSLSLTKARSRGSCNSEIKLLFAKKKDEEACIRRKNVTKVIDLVLRALNEESSKRDVLVEWYPHGNGWCVGYVDLLIMIIMQMSSSLSLTSSGGWGAGR